ncbi:MAG TPA: hypothetical protein VKH82_13385 [Candidatus Binatia bacterium]|nr:hypothetical protein [Candidatus Binatia bacterium]
MQKQPTRCASRPKLIRASGATNAAFATADWLTRTTLPATFTSTGAVPLSGPSRESVPMTTSCSTSIRTGPTVTIAASRPVFTSQKVNARAASVTAPPLSTCSRP